MFVKDHPRDTVAHFWIYQMLLDERIAKIERMVAETLNEAGPQTKVRSIFARK